jgi:hypothetical protein
MVALFQVAKNRYKTKQHDTMKRHATYDIVEEVAQVAKKTKFNAPEPTHNSRPRTYEPCNSGHEVIMTNDNDAEKAKQVIMQLFEYY